VVLNATLGNGQACDFPFMRSLYLMSS